MLTSISIISVFSIAFYFYQKNKGWKKPKQPLSAEDKEILKAKVPFYTALNTKQKNHFNYKIIEFLDNIEIIGVSTQVNREDELLIGASAIIPIFMFKKWQYHNLDEVLLYPTRFNKDFEIEGPDRRILGMVGYGFMEGKMILSKEALHLGFENETDKHNTAIHEFIHLIDKADGKVDGIPQVFLEKQYIIPWMKLVMTKIIEMKRKHHKDINPYGATNQAEFFAVVGTYFFERPKLLKRKHPELYKMLEEIFDGQ
jgi:Mlc titration factor MtfA (ptsG expression regulator)